MAYSLSTWLIMSLLIVSYSAPTHRHFSSIFDFENMEDLTPVFDIEGSVTLSDELSFSGNTAVKFTSLGGGYSRNFISVDLEETKWKNIIHGRMMIWVDDPGGNAGDFTFVNAHGLSKTESGAPENTSVYYRYRVAGTARPGTLMSNYDTRVDVNGDGSNDWPTDCYDHSEKRLPRLQWSCVEWRFDTAMDSLEYFFNGEHLSDLGESEGCLDSTTQDNEWYAPKTFDRISLGIEQYHRDVPARTMYIDDLILDTNYIGCPDGDYKLLNTTNNPEPESGDQNGSLISSGGTFTSGRGSFVGYFNSDTGFVTWGGEALFTLTEKTTEQWHAQLQHELSIEKDMVYIICFDAKAEANRTISVNIDTNGPDYASLMGGEVYFPLTIDYQAIRHTFTALDTDDSSRVIIGVGLSDADVAIDNFGVFAGDACNPK